MAFSAMMKTEKVLLRGKTYLTSHSLLLHFFDFFFLSLFFENKKPDSQCERFTQRSIAHPLTLKFRRTEGYRVEAPRWR